MLSRKTAERFVDKPFVRLGIAELQQLRGDTNQHKTTMCVNRENRWILNCNTNRNGIHVSVEFGACFVPFLNTV